MNQGPSEGIHAVAVTTAVAATRGTSVEGVQTSTGASNECRGYKWSLGDSTNENKQAQSECREYEQA